MLCRMVLGWGWGRCLEKCCFAGKDTKNFLRDMPFYFRRVVYIAHVNFTWEKPFQAYDDEHLHRRGKV